MTRKKEKPPQLLKAHSSPSRPEVWMSLSRWASVPAYKPA